jgi:hypothetical protein
MTGNQLNTNRRFTNQTQYVSSKQGKNQYDSTVSSKRQRRGRHEISPKKGEVKSPMKPDSEGQEDDEQRTLDIEDAEDFDTLWRAADLQSQAQHAKGVEESEAHIFQRLKESASKLIEDPLFSLVKYHIDQPKVIEMQREAADIIRRSVDSEYHEHFDVPHNHISANNVLGSAYLKSLIETYYDLRPGASIAKYKQVEDVIADFGKGEKDCFFDIRRYARTLQQVRGAY